MYADILFDALDAVQERGAPAPRGPLRRKIAAALRAAVEASEVQLRRLDPPRKPRPERTAEVSTLADRLRRPKPRGLTP